MRGTEFAIAEIIWWMLASALLGIVIGWLLHRVFGTGRKAKEAEAKYAAKSERYAELSQELADWKTKASNLELDNQAKSEKAEAAESKVTELEGSLAGARTELDSATQRATTLETNLADMSEELESASSRAAAMEEKVGSATEASGRVAQLEAELADVKAAQAGSEVANEEYRGTVAGLEAKIAELEAALAAAAGTAAVPSDLEALAAGEAEDAVVAPVADWSQGETALGTPGASHSDDLKVINGIGPKLEETLNEFGIKTWEQLATLTDEQVATVDAALEEFPGRITRDEWVSQAADLVTRFPDRATRPDRTTFLNEAPD